MRYSADITAGGLKVPESRVVAGLLLDGLHGQAWKDAIMKENVLKVHVDAGLEEVAEMMDHYDLLAVPVVDSEDRIQGIVTVDDALDVLVELLPERFRRRKRRSDRRTRA